MNTMHQFGVDPTDRDTRLRWAAAEVFDHELALHSARVTGNDGWISAAGDRLHEALVAWAALKFELRPAPATF
ncbi:MAG: hypothetical protein ACR2KJ_10205 [Jatrophihabitans sp.]